MDLFNISKLTRETKWNASNCIVDSHRLSCKNFFPRNLVSKLLNFETKPRGTAWNGHKYVMQLPFTPSKQFFQDDIGDIRKPFISTVDLLDQLRWMSQKRKSTILKRSDAEDVEDTDSYTEQDAAPEPHVTSTTQDLIFADTRIIPFGSLMSTTASNRQTQRGDIRPRYSRSLPNFFLNSLQSLDSFSGRMTSVSQPPLQQAVGLINLPVLTPHQLEFQKTPSDEFRVLGSGLFGVVYLATCLDDGRLVAVKRFYDAIEVYAAIVQEAKILKLLEPTGFVPRFYGLCPEARDSRKATIVQEFYGNGVTLRSLISDSNYWHRLPIFVKLNIVYQLVYGLKTIHEKGVLINDIKDDNILVDLNEHRIRYIDFGHATHMCGKVFHGTAETNAVCRHLAPEVRAGMQSTAASDVYSLGYTIQRVQLNCLQQLVHQCLQNEARFRPDLEYILYVLNEFGCEK